MIRFFLRLGRDSEDPMTRESVGGGGYPEVKGSTNYEIGGKSHSFVHVEPICLIFYVFISLVNYFLHCYLITIIILNDMMLS